MVLDLKFSRTMYFSFHSFIGESRASLRTRKEIAWGINTNDLRASSLIFNNTFFDILIWISGVTLLSILPLTCFINNVDRLSGIWFRRQYGSKTCNRANRSCRLTSETTSISLTDVFKSDQLRDKSSRLECESQAKTDSSTDKPNVTREWLTEFVLAVWLCFEVNFVKWKLSSR